MLDERIRLFPNSDEETRIWHGSDIRRSRSFPCFGRLRFAITGARRLEPFAPLVEISEQSYYRWRREYGGLKLNQAKRLKDLERENSRLRKVVSDLTSTS